MLDNNEEAKGCHPDTVYSMEEYSLVVCADHNNLHLKIKTGIGSFCCHHGRDSCPRRDEACDSDWKVVYICWLLSVSSFFSYIVEYIFMVGL